MSINRHTPYKFNNGQTIKNRVIVPPMASQTADENGFVTDRTMDHYRRLSRSKAGLVFAEYSYIHTTGRGEAYQLGADSDAKVPGLKQVASVLHQAAVMAGLQLVHVGGKTNTDLTGAPLMGPSAIPVPVNGWNPETPHPMSEYHIKKWQEWFVAAAGRAAAANFDVVELHAAHGYGLNQWLSPITNKRSDSFGGSIEGRSRMLLQIASKIKVKYPKILLSVRLPAQDYLDGGLTVSEMAWVVSRLELIGTDLIDVSSGIGGWKRPEGRLGEGYLTQDAALLKAHTAVPVVGVGGIKTAEYIDNMLQERKADFAAVGRAILHDPENWGNSNLAVNPFGMGAL